MNDQEKLLRLKRITEKCKHDLGYAAPEVRHEKLMAYLNVMESELSHVKEPVEPKKGIQIYTITVNDGEDIVLTQENVDSPLVVESPEEMRGWKLIRFGKKVTPHFTVIPERHANSDPRLEGLRMMLVKSNMDHVPFGYEMVSGHMSVSMELEFERPESGTVDDQNPLGHHTVREVVFINTVQKIDPIKRTGDNS